MTENSSQTGGEGEPCFIASLNLANSFQLVFNGILDRNNFTTGIVGMCQSGIEGGSFTAAGGA